MYYPLLTHTSGPKMGKFIGKAKIREDLKTITWPSGAVMKFSYLATDKDAEFGWQGQEITACMWDEFGQSSDFQFHYIRSRLRSKSRHKSRMFCTMNPNQDHVVYAYVKQFLDEEGYPIRELSGKRAYFVIVDGVVHTAWSKKDLETQFPGVAIKTYTYIPSNLDDNAEMLKIEPEYKDTLASLPPEQQRALLMGCWHYRSSSNLYFNRNWIEIVDTAPKDVEMARGWDLASTKPHPENPKPDYTAGVKMAKGRDGFYYIMDADRFQMSPGERNREMAKIGKFDGPECYVVVPLDPGAAGKVAYQELAKIFIEEGLLPKSDETRGDKIKRFEPFSSAAQSGLVRIVRSTFNPANLEAYLKELEGFTGARSHGTKKDDWVDATSSVFSFLCKKKVLAPFSLPQSNSPTLLANSGLTRSR